MGQANSSDSVRDQYRTDVNLRARLDLHARYSENPYGLGRWIFDRFELPDEARILELGCGPASLWVGNLARVPDGWDITLSDFSPGMLDAARDALAGSGRGFTFEVIDAGDIPHDDATFDAVIANHMLYHVADLDRALSEIRRILTPGGRFYASTNGSDHLAELRELLGPIAPALPFLNDGTVERFSLANGAAALERHFSNIRVEAYEDALAITDVEPLVAYALSMRDAAEAINPQGQGQLRKRIQERIAAEGVYRITKRPGMFSATAPR